MDGSKIDRLKEFGMGYLPRAEFLRDMVETSYYVPGSVHKNS